MKNHTDKERFAAALSCIATEILTLLFAGKRRRSSSSPYQPPRSRSCRVPDLKVPIFRGSASFITITMTIWFYSRDKKAILKKVEKENRKVDPIYKRRPQNINNKLKSNNHDELMKN